VLAAEMDGFSVTYHDIRTERDPEEAVKIWIQREFIAPFDLTEGPLMRVNVFQVEDKKWILTHVMHHMISDGWSMGILIRELLAYYNAYANGGSSPFSPLRIQYKDFSEWQQGLLISDAWQEHKQYWLSRLEGPLPVIELAGDRARPPMRTYKGDSVVMTIAPDLTMQLRSFTDQRGCTLFMGLLTLVNALLYRYTGQQDMIVGSPIAGRDHADLEDQIGFYINTLSLRTRLKEDDSFTDILDYNRKMTLEAYDHQAYPFDELIRELDIQWDMSRNAVFDVMVLLQNNEINYGMGISDLPGLKLSRYETAVNPVSKFDLMFDFVEIDDTLRVRIEYNTDIFDRDTMVRMGQHLEQLLRAAMTNATMPVCDLDYLSPEEKDKLLRIFNDTYVDYPHESTLAGLLEEQVSRSPDAVALVYEDLQFTFRQLNETANRWGHYLRENYGIGADDLVGIKLARNEKAVIAALGVLKSGAGCVPMDVDYPQERIDYILRDSGCRLLIDEAEYRRFEERSMEFDCTNPSLINNPADLAYVVYTSGSTGHPKGCMLENFGVINHLFSKIDLLRLAPGEVICHTSELHFVGGIWQLWGPLVTGGKLVLPNGEELRNMDMLLRKTKAFEVRILELIPSQLNEYLSYEKQIRLGNIRTLILTGEKLDPHFVHKCYMDNPGIEIINTYGQTESSDVTTYFRIPENPAGKILAGRPIQNTRHYVVSPNGSLCPVGVVGEICTRGNGMCRGYMNNPGLTAEKFVQHIIEGKAIKMYRTGDLGRWLPDGNMEVMGRKDDQVKIRGFRIELSEIENALQQFDGIEKAIVLLHEDPSADTTDKHLVAYIISGHLLNASELTNYLMGKIPMYMVPSHYVQIDRLPLLPNGKIDKKELSKHTSSAIDTGTAYVSPRNDIERELVRIWEEILKRENIGIDDNFFQLGGHSLKATAMLNKIRVAFEVDLSLKEIFRTPDIRRLGEEIQKKMWLHHSRQMPLTSPEGAREVVRI
jgi:amino acid adenylation domain-containing protein